MMVWPLSQETLNDWFRSQTQLAGEKKRDAAGTQLFSHAPSQSIEKELRPSCVPFLPVDQLKRARAAVGHVAPAALGAVEEPVGGDHQPVLAAVQASRPVWSMGKPARDAAGGVRQPA